MTQENLIFENSDLLIDIEGNKYKTAKIGNQIWMLENLKTTKYNDGSNIPNIITDNDWNSNEIGGYCFYENDENNNQNFGALYNWQATANGKLCPIGWHIPTENEWRELVNFLAENGCNFDETIGKSFGYNKIAKSLASSDQWNDFDKFGTIGNEKDKNNKSKFSALPGSFRLGNGKFHKPTNNCILWWSNTEHKLQYANQSDYAVAPSLSYNDTSLLFNNYSKSYGCYIRCVKDII